jgi:thioredoxin reductase
VDRTLPVAVIGAGPIGLAAAAHLILRNEPVLVFEASRAIAANLREWAHVRLFSVWDQCIDEAAEAILRRNGWKGVDGNRLPTGGDLVRDYLEPLAATPEFSNIIETDSRVVRIVRRGADRMSAKQRGDRPFEITVETAAGQRRKILARVVIDTSGTWQNPNPLGADGWPAEGELESGNSVRYGIPDVTGSDRACYAGKRVAVVGGSHSAANALLDLALLAEQDRATSITWVVRGSSLATVFGGGASDRLPARGALGRKLKALTEQGRLVMVMSFATERVTARDDGVMLVGMTQGARREIGPFDRIVASTGQRPDFGFARELQLDLHPAVESTRELGPLIDPNLHSCGTVPPHGWRELSHVEPDYFVAGIKSYGRAPTFLLLTGYEQVRSITAHLAGDHQAADNVRLVLPETGVCSATLEQVAPGGACCTAAAPHASEPCCERPKTEQGTICCAGPKHAAAPTVQASTCC